MKTARTGHEARFPGDRIGRMSRTWHVSRQHAWAAPQPDGTVIIGAYNNFFKDPGQYVFSKLPREGEHVVKGECWLATIYPLGLIEKRFCSPLSGTVTAVNHEMERHGPRGDRDDAYGGKWLFRIRPSKPWELTSLQTSHERCAEAPE